MTASTAAIALAGLALATALQADALAGRDAPALLALALFTRLRPAAILGHPLRNALAASIRAEPGVTPPRLREALGCGWSTVVYHLRVLEKNGCVTSRLDGRHRRYFAAGAAGPTEMTRLAALANARTREVFELVVERPGVSRRDVALAVGFTPPAAVFHLHRLAAAGLVRGERDGRVVRYRGATRDVPRPSEARGGERGRFYNNLIEHVHSSETHGGA